MKTMGIVGGFTWRSTLDYYRVINEQVAARLGGRHSAKMVLWNVDFEEHLELQDRGGIEAVIHEHQTERHRVAHGLGGSPNLGCDAVERRLRTFGQVVTALDRRAGAWVQRKRGDEDPPW